VKPNGFGASQRKALGFGVVNFYFKSAYTIPLNTNLPLYRLSLLKHSLNIMRQTVCHRLPLFQENPYF